MKLLRLLRELGDRLRWPEGVEIVVVGGAAGILTGQLQRRLTSDCDVPLHTPQAAWAEIHRHVVQIARDEQLSETWLNVEVRGLWRRLPGEWRERAHEVGHFGILRVLAIGRRDLIAMKFIAGRVEDRHDLEELGVTPEEAEFTRAYLEKLGRSHPGEATAVRDALELLEFGGLVRGELGR